MSAVPQRPGNVRRRTLIGGGIAAVVAAGAGIVWATRRPEHPAAAPKPGPDPATSSSAPAIPAGPPGTALWSMAVPPDLVRRPRVVDGVVVVEGANTVALRVADGSTAWQLLGSSHHVTVADGLLYVQQGTDGQHTLSAMHPSDGTIQSTANIADSVQALTVAGATGYLLGSPHEAATSATLLRAIDVRSGAPKWTFPKALGLGNYPIVDDQHVYVGGSGVIWAVDRATGAVRWQRAIPQETRPSVRGLAAGLVITRGGGGTYALDPATGAIRWKLLAADGPYLGSQAGVDGDTLYTGSIAAPGYLRAVDATNGTERWKIAASSPASRAMVSGGVVYATGGDTVDALGAADGRPKWTYALHDTCTVEPVAGDGLVFAATEGGHLHAIHTG
jgi:outer membrane protein assembly factor BamB